MFNWFFNKNNTSNNDNNSSQNNNLINIISTLLNLYQQNPQELNQLIQLFLNSINQNSNQTQTNSLLNRNNIINNRLIENGNQLNNNQLNSNKKRTINSESEVEIDDLVRQMETTSKKSNFEEKKEEKKENKRRKEKTIIWTRISSKNQENNTSLERQEKECKDYIQKLSNDSSLNNKYHFPTDSITLKMIGSGYSLSGSVKENFNLIDGYLDDNYKLTIVCYMPDRFLRLKSKALNFITKCNENGSVIHFVKSIDNNPLISDRKQDFEKLEEFFSLAERESQIKSTRSKDSAECKIDTLVIRSLDDPETIKIRNFIHLFLNGAQLNIVIQSFKELVDWDSHPDWYASCYDHPIDFNHNLTYTSAGVTHLTKCNSEVDKESRIESIVYLFKQFQIQIPALFNYRKRWDAKFVKRLSVDHMDQITSDLNNL